MPISSLDLVFQQSAEVGLTEALELLTNDLNQQYANSLEQFNFALIEAERHARALEIHQEQITEFLRRLSILNTGLPIRPELSICLLHSSYSGDPGELYEGIFRKKTLEPRPSPQVGYPLMHLCMANLMFRKGLAEDLGAAMSSRLFSFLGQSLFVHRFWIENSLGPPSEHTRRFVRQGS